LHDAIRGAQRREGEVERKKGKEKLGKRGDLSLDKTKGPPLMFLNAFFFSFPNAFESQGFGPVWVQFPKWLYMKKVQKHQNH
jgi:hypothetical protein